MQQILVPVDFSADSIKALEKALYIANNAGAAVRLVHVDRKEEFDPLFLQQFELEKRTNSPEALCEALIAKVCDSYTGGCKLDYVVTHGKVYAGIIQVARDIKADLIVMGTHGSSGFEEMWIGSNAYKVVSRTDCPVITIRHGFRKEKFQKIILPIDAYPETRAKVEFTARLAKILQAEVHVVDVRASNDKDVTSKLKAYAEQTEEYFTKVGVPWVRSSRQGNVVDEIISYAVHEEAELISIVSNRKGTPVHMSMDSTAQQMVNHSPLPVLSIRPKL